AAVSRQRCCVCVLSPPLYMHVCVAFELMFLGSAVGSRELVLRVQMLQVIVGEENTRGLGQLLLEMAGESRLWGLYHSSTPPLPDSCLSVCVSVCVVCVCGVCQCVCVCVCLCVVCVCVC